MVHLAQMVEPRIVIPVVTGSSPVVHPTFAGANMRLREHTDLPTRKLNRLQARTPKQGLFWCSGCDRNHVGKGEKCNLCGFQHGARTVKPKELV